MGLVENQQQEDKKHPVQKAACVMGCTLLHVISVTAVRKRENTNTGLGFCQSKMFLEKSEKCIWQKKQARETGTINSCTYCKHINLKEKDRNVKHLMK